MYIYIYTYDLYVYTYDLYLYIHVWWIYSCNILKKRAQAASYSPATVSHGTWTWHIKGTSWWFQNEEKWKHLMHLPAVRQDPASSALAGSTVGRIEKLSFIQLHKATLQSWQKSKTNQNKKSFLCTVFYVFCIKSELGTARHPWHHNNYEEKPSLEKHYIKCMYMVHTSPTNAY